MVGEGANSIAQNRNKQKTKTKIKTTANVDFKSLFH